MRKNFLHVNYVKELWDDIQQYTEKQNHDK